MNNKPKPFLKWVGGKTRLMNKLKLYFPKTYNNYFEPFLGGGSVFFNFTPENATLSDLNQTLINTYSTIRDNFETVIFHVFLFTISRLGNYFVLFPYYDSRTRAKRVLRSEAEQRLKNY